MFQRGGPAGKMLPLIVALMAAALAYFSPVSNTNSDPQFGLLVSQAMLRDQTVKMDRYREAIAPIIDQAFVNLDGHTYYYFPLGTPIFSMPVVGAANLLGYDMADVEQEAAVQNLISAVLVGITFLVIHRICRCFLPAGAALLLAAAVFLGSALISTMSTALWSIDYAVLFVSLALLVLCKLAAGENRPAYPFLLGFFLFGTYLCRPSTFLFVALVLGYLLLVERPTFWRTAVFAFLLLAGFLLFIRLGYGSWLPPYYNDFGRLAVERRPLLEALSGNLISPSRGLFIYSPIFLLTFVGAALYYRKLKRKPLYWLIISWFLLQLLLVARTTRWWGGLSFGPRILAELLPGLVLLAALVGQQFLERPYQRPVRLVGVGIFGGLALWAVFLNSYQGLFNQYTAWWHSALTPNVDYEPDYLWNWQYAQFLADNDLLCGRDSEYISTVLQNGRVVRNMYPYQPGRPLDLRPNKPFLIYEVLNGPAAGTAVQPSSLSQAAGTYLPLLIHDGEKNLDYVLSGFSDAQPEYRWSMCETVGIGFKLDGAVDAAQPFTLSIESGSFGRQRVGVMVNGVELPGIELDGRPQPPVTKNVTIPPGVLVPGEVNQIVLSLPDSVIPDIPKEERRLGLAIVSFTLQPSGK